MGKALLKKAAHRRIKVKEAIGFASDLTEQLRMAGQVQRDFLPRQMPNSDKLHWETMFLPAEWVSGDIYDVSRLDEKHIGFYIADVVGHGMPAALLTMFLKQALVMRQTTQNSYHIFQPSEAMHALNVRMTEQKLSDHKFITCCYCLLNIETLELTYSRAGHPYPVLIRQNQAPKALNVKGSLIGIFEQAEFPQQTIQLQSGDKLLVYSDGVEPYIGSSIDSENFNLTNELSQITDKRLDEIMKTISDIAQNKNADLPEKDDITVVGLEIL